MYGLEKFWAFLKYSGRSNKTVDSCIKDWLNKFKNLEDFRVLVSFLMRVRLSDVKSIVKFQFIIFDEASNDNRQFTVMKHVGKKQLWCFNCIL